MMLKDERACKQPLRPAATTLLTLPVTDFPGAVASNGIADLPQSLDGEARLNRGDDSDRYVLLQLPSSKKGGSPSSLSVLDLLSGEAGIIGPSGDIDARGGVGGSRQSQQACLVLEDKGASFTLSRLETSNALVLVPPAPATSDFEDKSVPPARKKPKIGGNGGSPLNPAPTETRARLLQLGGSGASFLEVRPHRLDRSLLRKKLSECEYDPYAPGSDRSIRMERYGHSVDELALTLRCSEREVRSALLSLEAFEMPVLSPSGLSGSSLGRRYGTLSEEAKMDATLAIVETLNECEEYDDLFSSKTSAGRPIEEEKFVERVVGRSGEGGADVLEESVVRHCLRSCAAVDDNGEASSGGKYSIDLNKVAIFLGHHLLNKQSEPWDELSFLAEWHKLVPGVGDTSRPNTNILLHAGVALRTSKLITSNAGDGGDNEVVERDHLVYFPEGKLPMEPEERFRKIFRKRERWSKEDLEPYVTKLAKELGTTVAEILMKHTCNVVDEDGIQWYVAR